MSRELFAFIEQNDPTGVRRQLERDQRDWRFNDMRMLDALTAACKKGTTEIVHAILECGRGKHWNLREPMFYTCLEGANPRVLELLLANGADLTTYDHFGNPLVHAACENVRGTDIVKFLLDRRMDIEATNCNSNTPLHWAGQAGSLGSVKELVNRGANIFALNNSKEAPLDRAKGNQKLAVVEYLVQHYVTTITSLNELLLETKYNPISDKAVLPIGTLNGVQLQSVVEAASQHVTQKQMREPDANGNTTMHHACATGVLPVIRFIYDRVGRDSLSLRNAQGDFPVHLACRAGASVEVFQFLLEQQADCVRQVDRSGELPLHICCRVDASREVMQYLVEQFPGSVHTRSNIGDIPLHILCRTGSHSPDQVRFLAGQDGATLRIPDGNGRLALHNACSSNTQSGPSKVTRILVELGGVNTLATGDNQGALPLHVACAARSIYDIDDSLAKFLIDAYPDSLATRTNAGFLPIMIISKTSSLDAINFFARMAPQSIRQ